MNAAPSVRLLRVSEGFPFSFSTGARCDKVTCGGWGAGWVVLNGSNPRQVNRCSNPLAESMQADRC